MHFEEFGKEHEKTIVMLHAANYVHVFAKQYCLSDEYHLIVPHLMGYGDETDKTFNAEEQIKELAEFISSLGKKVALVGFSLGAMVGFKLLSEHPELFNCAVLVSPWLIKDRETLDKVVAANEKQLASFKKKWLCGLIARMNGFTKEQRISFVEQMQRVTPETVKNAVDNGITLESVGGFDKVDVPVLALAGGKEQDFMRESVKKMAEMNENCSCEIWEKAAHNIPPMFAKRFNEQIRGFVGKAFDKA